MEWFFIATARVPAQRFFSALVNEDDTSMSLEIDGFMVAKCTQCGALYFPRRLLCRRCGGDAWVDTCISNATVEESTTVSHAIGQDRPELRHLATVRTCEGLRLVVGIKDPIEDGMWISLFDKMGAPFGRPSREDGSAEPKPTKSV
jgi:uncharacterized OB-fold protein